MAYRKILVPLQGHERDAKVLDAAFGVAKAFGSHVAGVYVKPDPSEVVPYLGEGISASVMREIMDAARDAAKRASTSARAALDQAAKAVGASVQPAAQAGAGVGGSFHVREGIVEVVIAEETRLADLVVFASPAEAQDATLRATLEAALLNGRKPLLLVPREAGKIAGAKIAVGWDGGGSGGACRVVGDAIFETSRGG